MAFLRLRFRRLVGWDAFALPNFIFRTTIIEAAKMKAIAMTRMLSMFELLRLPVIACGVSCCRSGEVGIGVGNKVGSTYGVGDGVV